MSYGVKLVMGFIGTALLCLFVGGLSESISSGFAGFSGGLPFMVIAVIVCGMAVYDFWDECVRKKK
ncbi:hypothetical protein [Roseobacter sp.]|uniref:hypothetical protein n=1 Tax=Roseobacter sp. TaxID=1907202 RepID=UPI002600DAAF|nr:hypothetical protein [Roseobacter sp.]